MKKFVNAFRVNKTLRSWLILASIVVLSFPALLYIVQAQSNTHQRVAASVADVGSYVNMIQGPGAPANTDRQIIMRYPLGRIGLWSRNVGEIADSVTRGVRLYPTIDQTVAKDNSDWRNTIVSSPAQTDITYATSSPAKGSSVSLTVTPNLSIYKYHFTPASSYSAVDILLGATANKYGPSAWTNNKITVVDNQTMEVSISNGTYTIFHEIKFSVPGVGGVSGSDLGFMKFDPSVTDVTVAVALSHTSFARAQQFFTDEFADFDFAAASQRLKDAWNAKLGKVDAQSADPLNLKKLYTALYSVYVNIVNATDGSPYASFAKAYNSPVLTVGSSIGWAYIGGGYFRCAFDQGRVVYYLLNLIDPAIMPDILHTYQAQYDYNKVMLGNWDPYCPKCWSDQRWGFYAGMFLRAKLMGITGVDYVKAKDSILDTFANPNNTMATSGYLAKGYIPSDTGGTSNYMSRALEWSTDVNGLALLANNVGDTATYNTWFPRGKNYLNNWNAANMVFQGKKADGSWGPANAGFFEGDQDRYAFDVIHDPLGLAAIYGDSVMTSKINTLLHANQDYNDYEPQYQILPFYSNSPSTAEDITRNRFLPQFNALNMWEGWWTDSDLFYTDNAAVVALASLGLYPIQAPGAQYVITSPSVDTAVIHGARDITIQANNNSPSNDYISAIKVNGASFPSHMISGERLASENVTITLDMTNAPSRIGDMYITGADGEILAANTDNTTYISFRNDAIGTTSSAKIYATKPPLDVSVDGIQLSSWTYDPASSLLNIKGIPSGNVEVRFEVNAPTPPPASPTPTAIPPTNTPTPTNTPAPTATAQPTSTPTPVALGPGLTGYYFNNTSLSGAAALIRTDATVNFNWGLTSPGPTVNPDKFSVRWTGYVIPLYTQTYTFYTRTDDGARLWVNNRQIINDWKNHAISEKKGTITLTAGVRYPITMEYYDNTGAAVAQLSWSSRSQPRQIIPESQLRTTLP